MAGVMAFSLVGKTFWLGTQFDFGCYYGGAKLL
jgi:hypothetical protein